MYNLGVESTSGTACRLIFLPHPQRMSHVVVPAQFRNPQKEHKNSLIKGCAAPVKPRQRYICTRGWHLSGNRLP